MNIPIQNIYYLLCYAWNTLDEKDRLNISIDNNTDLIDLLAKVIINGTKLLLKRGIDKNYLDRTNEISGIKGKLELSATLKINLLLKQKTICNYDTLSSNTLSNQIIFTTLYRLIKTVNLDKKIKSEIKNIMWMFNEVEIIELHKSAFKLVRLNRSNKFYGFLLKVCELIFNNSLPLEEKGTWQFIDFIRDERKMNKLFESFIRNFYKREQKIFPIVKKEQIKWKFAYEDSENGQYLPIMETDITLENDSSKIIMDTKFYSETMSGRFDNEKVNSHNLYQLFSYLLNQQTETPKTKHTTGVLIYPTIDTDYNLKYTYEGHNIFIKTVNLNTNWALIDKRLKEILYEIVNSQQILTN